MSPKDHPTIQIVSRKFDLTIQKTWTAQLVDQKDSLLVLCGEFEKEIDHPHLGIIRRNTVSHEFYWLDRWFNVFRFHEPDGALRNFYCNLNMPPKFQGNVLDYVDLDIDILVWKNFSVEVLDLEEFAENSKKFNYPAQILNKINDSLEELMRLIEVREFPFTQNFDF